MKRPIAQLEPIDDRDDSEQWEAVDPATELMLEGEFHEALVLLRDAIKKDPRNPYAYYYTGTALFELGRFDACIDAYRAALKVAPLYHAARVGLSHSLRIAGEAVEAIQQARKVLDHRPNDSDALFALGLAQASNGDRKGAISTLETFLESGPELEIAIEARAMLDRLTGGEKAANDDDGEDN